MATPQVDIEEACSSLARTRQLLQSIKDLEYFSCRHIFETFFLFYCIQSVVLSDLTKISPTVLVQFKISTYK